MAGLLFDLSQWVQTLVHIVTHQLKHRLIGNFKVCFIWLFQEYAALALLQLWLLSIDFHKWFFVIAIEV